MCAILYIALNCCYCALILYILILPFAAHLFLFMSTGYRIVYRIVYHNVFFIVLTYTTIVIVLHVDLIHNISGYNFVIRWLSVEYKIIKR